MSEYPEVRAKAWSLNEKITEGYSTYKITRNDIGHHFAVKVRHTDNHGLESPRTSNFPKLIYVNKAAATHGDSQVDCNDNSISSVNCFRLSSQ